jgi:alkylated DNA repair dioxygenase AlkB
MSCRNTKVLRDANHAFESSVAASNLSSTGTFLNEANESINSIKSLEAGMKLLSDKCDDAFNSLTDNVFNLQTEVDKLLARPQLPTAPTNQSAIDSHELLLKSISEQLQVLTANQSKLLESTERSNHTATSAEPSVSNNQRVPTPPTPHPPPPLADHHQKNVGGMISDFIDEPTASNLMTFLEGTTFKSENGRGTASFGAPYSYTGSKSSQETATQLPPILQPIVDEINKHQKDLYYKQYPSLKDLQHKYPAPVINSCLVNKFDGPDSFLPCHSDDEVTIHPESSIFTLSLGESCIVKFSQKSNSAAETTAPSEFEPELTCATRSLYHMTSKSQNFYQHMIEQGAVAQGTRYSLTFRSVSWKNKNSTCIVGDSNTGLLRFGTSKRNSFGELMPGQKFWSPRIRDIKPDSCVSYSNVVVLCGINDVKQPEINCQRDIENLSCALINKIKQIKQLNAKCMIFLCPLLPTKNVDLNKRVNEFNRILFRSLTSVSSYVQCVQGFQGFAEHDGMLVQQLSRTHDRHDRPDTLHLNETGARVLAGLIKQAIFLRLHKGVDRRKGPVNRVNGRPFSSVSRRPPPELQWGGRGGYQVR